MWNGWTSLILGICVIVSGLIPGMQGSFNMVLFGLLVAVTGIFFTRGWEGMVNGTLGVWLIISGFFPELTHVQNYVVVGILISIISLIRIFHSHRHIETNHKTA